MGRRPLTYFLLLLLERVGEIGEGDRIFEGEPRMKRGGKDRSVRRSGAREDRRPCSVAEETVREEGRETQSGSKQNLHEPRRNGETRKKGGKGDT